MDRIKLSNGKTILAVRTLKINDKGDQFYIAEDRRGNIYTVVAHDFDGAIFAKKNKY